MAVPRSEGFSIAIAFVDMADLQNSRLAERLQISGDGVQILVT